MHNRNSNSEHLSSLPVSPSFPSRTSPSRDKNHASSLGPPREKREDDSTKWKEHNKLVDHRQVNEHMNTGMNWEL